MSSIASSSTRPQRAPLASLPLHRFVPASNLMPSPVSIPSKRPPPTPEHERVQKSAKLITPKIKAVLEKDEFGYGKSPARRLFSQSPIASTSTIRTLRHVPSSPIILSSPSKSSASASHSPFPTTPSRSSPLDPRWDLDSNLDIHDPGFTIYSESYTYTIGIGTPDSKKVRSNVPSLAPDAGLHIPSSPTSSIASSINRLEDQENIPPSPSKHLLSPSHKGKGRSSTKTKLSMALSNREEEDAGDREDEETVSGIVGVIVASSSPGSASVSGTREKRGKSKLAQFIAGDQEDEEEDEEEGVDWGEELTPGRTVVGKGKGKERMTREVEG